MTTNAAICTIIKFTAVKSRLHIVFSICRKSSLQKSRKKSMDTPYIIAMTFIILSVLCGIGQHHPPDTMADFGMLRRTSCPLPTFGAKQISENYVYTYRQPVGGYLWRLSGIEPACVDHNNAVHLYTNNLSPSLRAVPHTPPAYSPRTYRTVFPEPSCGREGFTPCRPFLPPISRPSAGQKT